jgi:hypothetical protein
MSFLLSRFDSIWQMRYNHCLQLSTFFYLDDPDSSSWDSLDSFLAPSSVCIPCLSTYKYEMFLAIQHSL